jgi:hypothetical protein
MSVNLYTDIRKALRRGLELPTRPTFPRNDPVANPLTIGWLRSYGVTRLHFSCSNIECNSHAELSVASWDDHIEIGVMAAAFHCVACGRRGGLVRPDWASAVKTP